MRRIGAFSLHDCLMAGAGVVAAAAASPVQAQTRAFNVPAEAASRGIPDFARQAGVQILANGNVVAGRKTNAVRGTYSVEEGLRILLQGTGLAPAKSDGTGIIAIRSAEGNGPAAAETAASKGEGAGADSAAENGGSSNQTIVVTGTNIAGVKPTGSELIRIDRKRIERSGYSSTEQLIQSLPQTVRGSQAGATADGYTLSDGALAGLNGTYGSGINLRGLGTSSTLTLLNGHRLAASGEGSFTDISLIPISVIDHIDVLADGASAIYGADAVAGVANIVLRRKLDGLETRVRYGRTTDSGLDFLEASQIVGSSWDTGSGYIALTYKHQSELESSERQATIDVISPTTIFPREKTYNVVGIVNQELGERGAYRQEIFYSSSDKWSRSNYGDGGYYVSPVSIRQIAISGEPSYNLTGDWLISAPVSFSQQDEHSPTRAYDAYLGTIGAVILNDSKIKTLDANLKATGSLFELPGGTSKLALGVSYRRESYHRDFNYSDVVSRVFKASRHVKAAYVELFAPIVGPANEMPFVHSLNLSAAIRIDDYSDFGRTTNPKFGLEWAPSPSLKIHGSYGTSFRAPSVGREVYIQGFGFSGAQILAFNSPTGSGFVPVVAVTGSSQLKPETAKTFSVGADYAPPMVAGLRLSGSFFSIRYKNQIIVPPLDPNALNNPAYAGFLTQYATNAELLAALNSQLAPGARIRDFTGGDAGPNPLMNALTIFNYFFQNAAETSISGIDLEASFDREIGSAQISTRISASKLFKIDTAFSSTAPRVDLVDTYNNPASFKLRGEASLGIGSFRASSAVNYTGPYSDTSTTPNGRVNSYTTVDAVLTYDFSGSAARALHGFRATLAVTNLFDRHPPYIAVNGYGAHYDPTNASPLGRLVSVEVIKKW